MGIYLGLDSSTQSLKAELIDTESGKIIGSEAVSFGRDLPEYRCPGGFLESSDPLLRHADPLMWAAALDLLLSRLQIAGAPLDQVKGLSGSGQQHGSVYLSAEFEPVLSELDSHRKLAEQLKPTLTRKTSPIWMDRTTAAECAELQARFGDRLQRDTGSPAIERFTGPQIRRFMKTAPDAYRKTSHIHLVSSFMCSLLIGKSAPIDYGDGAGMNLLNLHTLQWDNEIVEFTAPELGAKLPPVVPCDSIAGYLSPYYCRYGLSAGIPVVVWSGDNPCSLAGMGATAPGVAVISLGTSDTFFAAMQEFKTDPAGYGHVFGNPAGGFMSLICFTNGSPARERLRQDCGVDWNFFDRTAMELTPAGNQGNLMLPYFTAESTPLVLTPGPRYAGSAEFCAGTASVEVKIRALLESQALTMKLHSGWIGEQFSRIRVTGGASGSPAFRQILADVFQAEIERIAISDSAGLGAALRAANAAGDISFAELFAGFTAAEEITRPNPANAEMYMGLLTSYATLESRG